MHIWVVIPAYNEGSFLEVILKKLKEKGLSVLAVDDGSKDNTYEIAKRWADIVIRSKRNFGKGASLKKGITYLKENKKFDCIVTMDADGQHSLSDLESFFKAAEGGADFIIGNRMDNPEGMPYFRVLTNKFMSWLISRIVGQNIPDTQCGFRLIKREVLDKIVINTKKFEIESELLIKAARLGVPIKSIKIQSIYFKNSGSSIRPFSDSLRFIKFIFRLKNERN